MSVHIKVDDGFTLCVSKNFNKMFYDIVNVSLFDKDGKNCLDDVYSEYDDFIKDSYLMQQTYDRY